MTNIRISKLAARHVGKIITAEEGGVTYTSTLVGFAHEADTTTISVKGMGRRTYPSATTVELYEQRVSEVIVSCPERTPEHVVAAMKGWHVPAAVQQKSTAQSSSSKRSGMR